MTTQSWSYLVELEESNKHLDLVLRYSVDDFSIVSDQFHDHLSNVQSDVTLPGNKAPTQHEYSISRFINDE